MTETPGWTISIFGLLTLGGTLVSVLLSIYRDLLRGGDAEMGSIAFAGLTGGIYWVFVSASLAALARHPLLAAHRDALWPKLGAVSLLVSVPLYAWLVLAPAPTPAPSAADFGAKANRRWPALRFPRPQPGRFPHAIRRGPPRVVTIQRTKDASGDDPPPRQGSGPEPVSEVSPAEARSPNARARPAAGRPGVQAAWEEIDQAFQRGAGGGVLRTGEPENRMRLRR